MNESDKATQIRREWLTLLDLSEAEIEEDIRRRPPSSLAAENRQLDAMWAIKRLNGACPR